MNPEDDGNPVKGCLVALVLVLVVVWVPAAVFAWVVFR